MCRGLSKIWFIAVIIVAVSIQTCIFIEYLFICLSSHHYVCVCLSSVSFWHRFILLILAMSIKCWRCSSDAANAQFCADPFEPNDTKFIYVECVDKESHKDNKRSVCKKAKKIGEHTLALGYIVRCVFITFIH